MSNGGWWCAQFPVKVVVIVVTILRPKGRVQKKKKISGIFP